MRVDCPLEVLIIGTPSFVQAYECNGANDCDDGSDESSHCQHRNYDRPQQRPALNTDNATDLFNRYETIGMGHK